MHPTPQNKSEGLWCLKRGCSQALRKDAFLVLQSQIESKVTHQNFTPTSRGANHHTEKRSEERTKPTTTLQPKCSLCRPLYSQKNVKSTHFPTTIPRMVHIHDAKFKTSGMLKDDPLNMAMNDIKTIPDTTVVT